jgi:hypothetical protein
VTSNAFGITRLYDVPVPTVSPGSLFFNSPGSKKITIKNTVSASQSIQAAIAGRDVAAFAITSNTCGSTLASAATCTITVEYTPTQASSAASLWLRSNGAFILQAQLLGQ